MGRKDEKPPIVKNAEITEDGCLIVEFDRKLLPSFHHTEKAIFEPEVLFGLVQEFGLIPRAAETDFPGLPIVTEESVLTSEEKKGEKEKEN